jgi:hypothetical protein
MNNFKIKLNKKGFNFYKIKVNLKNKKSYVMIGNVMSVSDEKILVAFSAKKDSAVIDSIFVRREDVVEIVRIKAKDLVRV